MTFQHFNIKYRKVVHSSWNAQTLDANAQTLDANAQNLDANAQNLDDANAQTHFSHFAPVSCLTLQTLPRQMVSDTLLTTSRHHYYGVIALATVEYRTKLIVEYRTSNCCGALHGVTPIIRTSPLCTFKCLHKAISQYQCGVSH